MSPNQKAGGRKAIALLIDQVDGFYHSAIIRGMRDFTRGAGLDLFVLSGPPFHLGPNSEKAISPAFELASSPRVSGIVLGSLSLEKDERKPFAEFAAALEKPTVCISMEVPGLPSVFADNRAGIRSSVEHLAKVHGHKRIAYLSGPDWNVEARERLGAYRDAMQRLCLEVDPALIFYGDFLYQSGQALAVAKARGELPPFDALLAANDGMAIGFQAECESLGLKIPGDIAVCGFDDEPEAIILPSPLTTARQPYKRLCSAAGEILLALLEGKRVSGDAVVIPTEFIVRESCGCRSPLGSHSFGGRRDAQGGAKASSETASVPDLDSARLIASLESEASGRAASGSFGREIEAVLAERHGEETNIADLPSALSSRFASRLDEQGEPEWLSRARALLFEGELRIFKAQNDAYIRDNRYLRSSLDLFSAFSQGIGKVASTGDSEKRAKASLATLTSEIATLMDKSLPKARIGYCALCLVSGTESTLCYSLGGRSAGRSDYVVPAAFPAESILPEGALPAGEEAFSCVVLPLLDSGTCFGFIIFNEFVGQDSVVFELYRSQISNALGRARMTEELVAKETLERVETEKLAAMGTLVAGIAHEINTPIGVCVTAASHAEIGISKIRKSLDDASLTRSDLASFLEDGSQTISILSSNLDRAASLVTSFKRIAVDASSEERRFFRLKEYLGDILATLSPRLKRTKLRFEIDCPGDLEIDSYPGSFAQIVTNLVLNSIAHGYDEPAEGRILIASSMHGGILTLTYQDDGRGIPREILGRIFDPYFTTKRESGGSGLGLYIVYNVVTGILKGHVAASSSPGRGATFTITMPIGEGEYRYAASE